MRSQYKVLLTLSLIVLSTACKDSFLETSSPFGVAEDRYYQTEEQAFVALTACYDNLSAQFDRLYGLGIDAIGMYASDLTLSGRTNPRVFSMFETNAQTGAEITLYNIWRECYSGIYRCNIFLEKIEGIEEIGEDLKQRMIAEATFLRAYYHFELTKLFGDVPLVTEALPPLESYLARTSKAQVVEQMIADFQAAAKALPERYSGQDKGRITKGAAEAYLTKLYVYEQRWQEAVNLGINVINSGQYGLHDNYLDNFSIDHENGIESIFEIQCKTGTATGEGNAHYDLESFEDTPNPRGYTQPRREFTDSFETNADGVVDPRKDATVDFNIISLTLFGSKKYVQVQEPQPTEQFDGELNYKLMRYSDFLLLYAEALNESGQTAEALSYINQVRQRPSVNMLPLAGLDQVQTRAAIYDERKWELGLEGHRFFDIARWGIAKELLEAQGRSFVEGVHELMPIPIIELDLNPNLTQNPGYN